MNDISSQKSVSDIGRTSGILSIVFAIVGIFILWLIFSILSFILSLVALWKRQFLLGGIGLFLAIVAAATSPTIWTLYLGAKVVNEGMHKQEQMQQVAKEIAETKKTEKANNDAAIVQVWVQRLAILQEAFKESEQKWIEAFGKSSTLELYSISKNPDLGITFKPIKEFVKVYLWKLPDAPGGFGAWTKQGTPMDIVVQLKYLYVVEVAILVKIDNDEQKKEFAYALWKIENVLNALEKGELSEYPLMVRILDKSGTIVTSKFMVAKLTNGRYALKQIQN